MPVKKGVPPSLDADVGAIETLLNRNLPKVFGEGDPAGRRAAIQELYSEDCVLYVPPGIFVGHDALDKFAGDLRATHPHYVFRGTQPRIDQILPVPSVIPIGHAVPRAVQKDGKLYFTIVRISDMIPWVGWRKLASHLLDTVKGRPKASRTAGERR